MSAITFKRILKSGYLNFRRNGWLSTATILVMVLVLFVLGNLLFVGAFAHTVLDSLESKIDVSVYFVPTADEGDILALKQELESFPEVVEVSYVSREEALAQFRARHQGNALIATALEEVGENPLEASLNVKAQDPSKYAAISTFLAERKDPLVDKINYFENEQLIQRLGAILETVRGSGVLIAFVLSFIAILVSFNTIRLAIYTMREEVGIMRLVGATSWFIRGPFLVSGVLYGSIAALITITLLFPFTWLVAPKVMVLVPEFDIFRYFLSHLVEVFGILLLSGIMLGSLSSVIAIRKYLRV